MQRLILAILCLVFAAEAFGAKKDFKGLFGSYRREKFTENEARPTDFGIDILFSSMFPVTPIVKSIEAPGAAAQPLYYSTFFNLEAAAHVSFAYRYQLYFSAGYYTYDTRKQNSLDTANFPLFHEFTLTAYPFMAGIKYRFSESDIVPYVGIGAGIAFTKRRASYDSDKTLFDERTSSNVVAQAQVGLEFYIASRTGIRLEMSAYYYKIDAATYQPSTQLQITPAFQYEANPISLRYASGLFVLF